MNHHDHDPGHDHGHGLDEKTNAITLAIVIGALFIACAVYWGLRRPEPTTIDVENLRLEVELGDCADDLREAAAQLFDSPSTCERFARHANKYDGREIDAWAVCGAD